MASKPRIIVPFHFYQLSSICIPELNIFKTPLMKSFFLNQLSITLKKFSFHCLAWVLMDDHYHLVIKSSDDSISIFMQRLNSVLAKHFNYINKRKGAVFSKRFSSIVIQEGNSLKSIIRHIHLNPVRKGVCTLEKLDNYEWAGHHSLVNNISDSIINSEELLSLFGGSGSLDCYRNFLKSDSVNPQVINLMKMSNEGTLNFHNSNCFVIGDREFTELVFVEDRCRKAQMAKYVRENLTLNKMLYKVKKCVDFDIQSIFRHGRHNEISTVRELFAAIGHCDYEFKCTEIAEHLRVTTSAVSRMVSRSKRIAGFNFLKEMICC